MIGPSAETSTACWMREDAAAGPPAKRLTPRSGGPGFPAVGNPGAPYGTAVPAPVTFQPGIGTVEPSLAPAPSSAPPFWMSIAQQGWSAGWTIGGITPVRHVSARLSYCAATPVQTPVVSAFVKAVANFVSTLVKQSGS